MSENVTIGGLTELVFDFLLGFIIEEGMMEGKRGDEVVIEVAFIE